MKVHAHISLKPLLEYNQNQMSHGNKVGYDFLTIAVVSEMLCRVRVVLEGKSGKAIPESSGFNSLGPCTT